MYILKHQPSIFSWPKVNSLACLKRSASAEREDVMPTSFSRWKTSFHRFFKDTFSDQWINATFSHVSIIAITDLITWKWYHLIFGCWMLIGSNCFHCSCLTMQIENCVIGFHVRKLFTGVSLKGFLLNRTWKHDKKLIALKRTVYFHFHTLRGELISGWTWIQKALIVFVWCQIIHVQK